MAEDGFGYVLALEDELTGPAGAEVRALRQLQGAIGDTDKTVKGLHGSSGNLGRALAGIPEHAEHAGSSLGHFIARVSEYRAIEKAIDLLKDLVIELPKFAIEAAEFKENTVAAYAAVQGTAEEGEKTFAEIDKMAHVMHFPAKQAHDLAKDLMLQGLEDTKLITATVAANASLIKEGQIAGAEKLKSLIERATASGHFELRGATGKGGTGSGRALAGLGIHLPDLIADIAKRTGHSIGQVKTELQQGKIGVETGIAALVDAVNSSAIGKAGREKFGLEEFKADVVNTFTSIAQDVDLGPIKQALVDMDVALGGIADKNGPVADLFQTMVKWVGIAIEDITLFGLDLEIWALEAGIATYSVRKDFSEAFGAIGKDFGDVIPAVYQFIKIVGIGVVQAVGFAAKQVEVLGAGIGFLVDALSGPMSLAAVGPKLAALRKTVGDIEGSAVNQLAEGGGMIENIRTGKDMGEGLAVGAKSSAPDVEQAVSFTVKRGIGAGRQAADAHSPSLAMMDLGRDMGDGLTIGFDSTDISSAIQSSVRGAVVQPPSEPSEGHAASGHTLSLYGDIYIGKEHESGEHLRPIIESGLTDVLERFALELGA